MCKWKSSVYGGDVMLKSVCLYHGLVVSLLLLGGISVAASPGYYCYKTTHSIDIDGRISESAWNNVPYLELRNITDSPITKHSTEIKLLWDRKYLYICAKSDKVSGRLNILLNPTADTENYIEFDIQDTTCNIWTGKAGEISTRNKRHCADLQLATQSTGSESRVEIAVPWASLSKFNPKAHMPQGGDIWRVFLNSDNRSFWPVIKPSDRYNLNRSGYLTFSDHPSTCKKVTSRNKLDSKMVWLWTMQDKTDAQVVSAAKSLGFNAISARSKQMVDECHKQGIQAFAALWFGSAPAEYAQVIKPEEMAATKWDKGPAFELYQYGGEPILGGDIYREGSCWCLDRPEALEYGRKAIDENIADGYDGIAFDAIGYTNLYACFCPVTLTKQQEFRRAHPELSEHQAIMKYSEQSLVNFYDDLCKYARSKRPDIKLTTHIYPVFAPNPIYGSQLPLDYCGQTVAWFFKPHWNLEKVKRYAYEVVQGAIQDKSAAAGAPFVGIYTLPPYDMHAKSADRVRQELRMIKKSGACAIQMAELGNILNNPEIAKVVKEELNDSSK